MVAASDTYVANRMDSIRTWDIEPAVRAIGLGAALLSSACVATNVPVLPLPISPAISVKGHRGVALEGVDGLTPGLTLNWNQLAPGENGCANPQEFSGQVNSRLLGRADGWLTSFLESDLQVNVEVKQNGSLWEGALSLRGAVEAERVVVGSACDEVITALALITALRLREVPAADPLKNEPPKEEFATNEPAEQLLVASVAQDVTSGSILIDPEKWGEEKVTHARVAVLGGYVSVPVPSIEISLRVDLRAEPSFGTWVWSGAVSYQQGTKGRFNVQGFFAQFDLCSPSFASQFWVRACGFARGGAHYVVASETEFGTTTPSLQPWAALGVGLHTDIPLHERLSLRSFAEAFAGVVRNEYFVAEVGEDGVLASENVASFRPSLLGLRLGIGLSYDL